MRSLLRQDYGGVASSCFDTVFDVLLFFRRAVWALLFCHLKRMEARILTALSDKIFVRAGFDDFTMTHY